MKALSLSQKSASSHKTPDPSPAASVFCRLRSNRAMFLTLVIFAIGFFLRLFFIGNIPGNRGVYQDEAYAGYEAWSLLHYGHDSWGYANPVYLTTWGTGMSVLQTICEIPFVALFGMTSFAIRLPRAILGCLELVAFYQLCKEIRGARFARIGTFILAVMPWDIMMSRWALDCNYLAPFLLFGLLFLIKARKHDSRYLLLSMLFYGLSLYCYAATWPVMPLLILGAYFWYWYLTRKIDIWFFLSIVLLAVLAIPLILFCLVNMGYLAPITGGFLDIPRMPSFRSGEMSLNPKDMLRNLYTSLCSFLSQDDGRVMDTTETFGLFYKFSYLLMVPGMALSLYRMHRERHYGAEAMEFLQLFCGLILCALLQEAYFSRVNIILLPMTYFLCVGVEEAIMAFRDKAKYILVFVYAISCFAFFGYYITDYDDLVAETVDAPLREALAYTDTIRDADDTICVLSDIGTPLFLFYDNVPTDLYLNTVVFREGTRTNIQPKYPMTFAWFDMTAVAYPDDVQYPAVTENRIFIARLEDTDAIQYLTENNLKLTYFDGIVVGEAQ